MWRYVLAFGNVVGVLAYFLMHWLPYHRHQATIREAQRLLKQLHTT